MKDAPLLEVTLGTKEFHSIRRVPLMCYSFNSRDGKGRQSKTSAMRHRRLIWHTCGTDIHAVDE